MGETLAAAEKGRVLHLSASTISAGTSGEVTVTATLTDAIKHVAPSSGFDTNTFSITGITVVATDTDGSTPATGTVTVNVIDDVPTVAVSPAAADASPATDSVVEGGTVGGAWTSDEGADGATTAVTSGGVAKTLASDGSVSFTTAEGTLTVFGQTHATDAGTWVFVSNNNQDNDPS